MVARVPIDPRHSFAANERAMEAYHGIANVPSFIQLPRLYWDGTVWRGPYMITMRTEHILNYTQYEPRGEKQRRVTSFPVTKMYINDFGPEELPLDMDGSEERVVAVARPRKAIMVTVMASPEQLDRVLLPITLV